MARCTYPPGHKARTVCPCGWSTTRRSVTHCSSCKQKLPEPPPPRPAFVPRTDAERDAAITEAMRANREAAGS